MLLFNWERMFTGVRLLQGNSIKLQFLNKSVVDWPRTPPPSVDESAADGGGEQSANAICQSQIDSVLNNGLRWIGTRQDKGSVGRQSEVTRVRAEFIPDRKFISAPPWRRQILIKKGRVEGDVFGTASRMICWESGERRGLPSQWTRPHSDTGGGQLAARYNYCTTLSVPLYCSCSTISTRL